MRSKLSAITARTPRSLGPFAAQSREEPAPYSLPASTMSGTPSCWYFCEASQIDISSPSGRWRVYEPSTPGTSALRNRMLPNVPRPITSWLPRRAPKVLYSATGTSLPER